MSDRPWKAEERRAAAIFGGTRYPASSGRCLDFESRRFVGQVKHVRRLSLTALEALAREVERMGSEQRPQKLGVVVIKRRAGRERRTPRLIVLTDVVWRKLAAVGNLQLRGKRGGEK